MTVGSNASSHFGIGRNESNRLVIEQYVALDDSAWTNGDVRDPTWSRIIPDVNPNKYTWTIEHEDGGTANRGVVEDDIWQASMELQVLLASGDPARLRAAGVTFREDSVAREGALIPKDATGFIDHHQISGPNKPYCFRPWLDDPGFVNGTPSRRSQLIAALQADGEIQGEDMGRIADLEAALERCRNKAAAYHKQRDVALVELEASKAEIAALKADPTVARIEELEARITAAQTALGEDQ